MRSTALAVLVLVGCGGDPFVAGPARGDDAGVESSAMPPDDSGPPDSVSPPAEAAPPADGNAPDVGSGDGNACTISDQGFTCNTPNGLSVGCWVSAGVCVQDGPSQARCYGIVPPECACIQHYTCACMMAHLGELYSGQASPCLSDAAPMTCIEQDGYPILVCP